MPDESPRYGIDELADLGGVSRRAVRYYVQEGLIPAPFGVGRGDHYGAAHLQALLRVKALQEAGHTLDEIRRPAARRQPAAVAPPAAPTPPPPPIEAWRRISLAPGVELHIAHNRRLPSAAALRSLSDWSRVHLTREGEDGHAGE